MSMKIFDLFKKTSSQKKRLETDKDFNELFRIVMIPGYNDNVPEVYLNTDRSYESVSSFNKSTAIVLPFSKGVEEFCVKKILPLVVESKVDYNLLNSFVGYLKLKGCPDIVVDSFIDCWKPGNELPPYKRVYDKTGKRIGIKNR